MDKETIIKGCEYWVNNHKGENFLLTYSSVVKLLDVLKEFEAEISRISNKYLALVGKVSKKPTIVMCKDCEWYDETISFCDNCHLPREQTFFCADGKHK